MACRGAWRWAVLGLLASEAVAGSYGSVEREVSGVLVSIDISVGSWSDHVAEGKAFAENEVAANKDLEARRPALRAMIDHYRAGKHPYAGRRAALASAVPKDRSGGLLIDLPFPAEESRISSNPDVTLSLFTHRKLSPLESSKLAADFSLSQLSPGGAFARPNRGAWTRSSRLDAQSTLGALLHRARHQPHAHIARLISMARQNEPWVRELATQPNPDRIDQPGSNPELGHFASRLLVAAIDQRKQSTADLARVRGLAPEDRADALATWLMFLTDAEWVPGLEACTPS